MTQGPNEKNCLRELGSLRLFAGLDATALQELTRAARWREYETRDVVVLEGDAQPARYYLQYGWLKVVKTYPAGLPRPG